MKATLQFLLPGERARMMLIAACIGLMTGCAIIVFRETVDLVHEILFVRGHELLRIGEGGWRRLLLPLLPITGALLLIPLSLAFPGEVNGYGLPGFLRRVNLENGIIRARTLFIKTIATALTKISVESATRMAELISPAKSAKPGASRMKSVLSPRSIVKSEVLMEI